MHHYVANRNVFRDCLKLFPPIIGLRKLRRCFKSPASHHFCCSYLKATKVSKSESTRKIEYVCNFWKCADVFSKLSKSVHAWRNCSLPKLAHFLRHSVWLSDSTSERVRVIFSWQLFIVKCLSCAAFLLIKFSLRHRHSVCIANLTVLTVT